ncbi:MULTISPECIES: YggN family protein [unclassified Shewanella]|uniref:YggN family protein n=1 Tax=Shewanella TaxID=22 RepID=UPI0021DA4B3B|nr:MULTISPECIES: YggN family protein [unclassified Shewanella]MCU8044681.1 YggN family protein [Shewanella sp. SM68]MCU8048967.1 YggN family protein [Shewanella sp. SM65]
MKLNKLLTGFALSGVILGASSVQLAQAQIEPKIDERCEVSLNYDVMVEPKKLVMSEKGTEKYRIEVDKLFVEGKQVNLTDKQKKLVTQYADEVSTQVPEVIELVNEAVSLASKAVGMALTPLMGDAAGAKFNEMMAGVQKRVDSVAYKNGDSFYLGATEYSMQSTFNDEFEQEMEQIVQNSIGAIMMNLGGQIMSGGGENFEAKMDTFSQKMDKLGQDIEQQIESQSKGLEAKADRLCDRFENLLVLENQLRQEVPELAPYVLTQNSTKELRE